MPIGAGLDAYYYTRQNIIANAPQRSGVYAIWNATQCIYVGESNDIQARLLQHLNGDNACITRNNPTLFQYELADANNRVARQNELIRLLGTMFPRGCNQMLG